MIETKLTAAQLKHLDSDVWSVVRQLPVQLRHEGEDSRKRQAHRLMETIISKGAMGMVWWNEKQRPALMQQVRGSGLQTAYVELRVGMEEAVQNEKADLRRMFSPQVKELSALDPRGCEGLLSQLDEMIERGEMVWSLGERASAMFQAGIKAGRLRAEAADVQRVSVEQARQESKELSIRKARDKRNKGYT